MGTKSRNHPAPPTAKSAPISISDSEWLIMELLWASSPQGSQDLANELAGSKGWARTTTVTLLQRLVKKGAVRAEGKGARFEYSPAVERTACVTAETTHLLDRMFGGALHPLVAHFAKHRRLTKKDVAELRALLDNIDSEKN